MAKTGALMTPLKTVCKPNIKLTARWCQHHWGRAGDEEALQRCSSVEPWVPTV